MVLWPSMQELPICWVTICDSSFFVNIPFSFHCGLKEITQTCLLMTPTCNFCIFFCTSPLSFLCGKRILKEIGFNVTICHAVVPTSCQRSQRQMLIKSRQLSKCLYKLLDVSHFVIRDRCSLRETMATHTQKKSL